MLAGEEQGVRFALLDQRGNVPDDDFNARWRQEVAPLRAHGGPDARLVRQPDQ